MPVRWRAWRVWPRPWGRARSSRICNIKTIRFRTRDLGLPTEPRKASDPGPHPAGTGQSSKTNIATMSSTSAPTSEAGNQAELVPTVTGLEEERRGTKRPAEEEAGEDSHISTKHTTVDESDVSDEEDVSDESDVSDEEDEPDEVEEIEEGEYPRGPATGPIKPATPGHSDESDSDSNAPALE